LNHLWQRFLMASALVVGLAIGVGATVFGYSNLTTVDINWSVFHLYGVPLWTVAVVPVALLLVAGTLYHWIDGLHHFTEHMRHRHRVRELEAEVGRLRAHLDQVLEMPRHDAVEQPATQGAKVSLPPADIGEADLAMSMLEPLDAKAPEPEPPVLAARPSGDKKKRTKLMLEPKPAADAPAEHTNGADTEPAVPAQEA
jgi:DNA-binding transcriptional LysR family regulator